MILHTSADHRCDHHHEILRLESVTVRHGSVEALTDVSVHIPCGESVALLGPNGAGKSTLLRAIMGWHPLAKGRILIGDDHAHHHLPRFAYLPQRSQVDWDYPITVRDVVAQGRFPLLGPFRRFSRADHALVDDALDELHLAELQNRRIHQLSGGQQQRVFLARALAQEADIFLLDEPFTGLDPQARDDLAATLKTWHRQGRTILTVVHDLQIAREALGQAILLDRRLIAAGPCEQILTPDNLEAAFGAQVRNREAARV
ncbi:MAG: metal ABC transporter ATP-binding protein [Sumerlaeia bacterium]